MNRNSPFGHHPRLPLEAQSNESGREACIQQTNRFLLKPGPVAPMKRSERKRAIANAQFYSECCLHGIEPSQADLAARGADSQYKRWWVDSKYSKKDGKEDHPKRRRVGDVLSMERSRNEAELEKGPDGAMDINAPVVSSEDECSASRRMLLHRIGSADFSGRIRNLGLVDDVQVEHITQTKAEVVRLMQTRGGDTSNPEFLSAVNTLASYYSSRGFDERWDATSDSQLAMDGKWTALSKPTFSECKGRNERGEYIYSLGRVAFDMFRPTSLVCSLTAVYNSISPWSPAEEGRPLYYPFSLRKESARRSRKPKMRNYDIEIALTIEPGQTRRGTKVDTTSDESGDEYILKRPIHCLLTNHGYCLPDPGTPNRLSIWFTGGTLALQDKEGKLGEWKELFDPSSAPRRDLAEMARVLAARILVGAHLPEDMAEDGTMKYSLRRPIGGHGQVFCDVVFADESLRILRGHRGSLFVSTKLPT